MSHEEGKWELTVPIEQIDLEASESLRQSIEAQIDHLTIEEQRALEAASIAGASFSAKVVSSATGIDRDRLLELFKTLARQSRFVRLGSSQHLPDGSIMQAFEFVHALYREVFFWRQSPARRASLQKRVGAAPSL